MALVVDADPPAVKYTAERVQKLAECTVLAVDLTNFHDLTRLLPPEKLAVALGALVARLDAALDVYRMTGSGYYSEGRYYALGADPVHHADDAVRYGLHCLQIADAVLVDDERPNNGTLSVRVAAHSGPLVVLRLEAAPWRPTFVGRTVSDLARLLRAAQPGEVCCSRATALTLSAEAFHTIITTPAHSWNGRPSPKPGLRVLPEQPPDGVLGGACHLCPITLKLAVRGGAFLASDNNVAGGFGFLAHELRHMRMLYGPDTDTVAVQAAVRQAFEGPQHTRVETTLYTRAGMPVEAALAFDFVPTTRQLAVACSRLPRPDAATRPHVTTAAEEGDNDDADGAPESSSDSDG